MTKFIYEEKNEQQQQINKNSMKRVQTKWCKQKMNRAFV